MMEETKEIIREKLRTDSVAIGTSRTDAWAVAVLPNTIRNIVAIFLIGDGTASRTVNIEKKEAIGTYTMKFNAVPVSPAEIKQIPQTYSIEDPIIVLEPLTNLTLTASGGAPYATIVYWDK
jgi:hypothetical protein